MTDIFRHSKRGGGRKRKEAGKQEEDWMDMEEEVQGSMDMAELARAAFGEEKMEAPETVTDNHSMGEASEVSRL